MRYFLVGYVYTGHGTQVLGHAATESVKFPNNLELKKLLMEANEGAKDLTVLSVCEFSKKDKEEFERRW